MHTAKNLTIFTYWWFRNSGSLNLLEPLGLVQLFTINITLKTYEL
jgi:hypothetical protein